MSNLVTGSPAAVLFDLDGTLIDSYPGIISAYHQVLTQLELGEMGDTEIRSLIGPSIQAVLEDEFGLTGARLQNGVQIYRDHYGKEGLFHFTKYEGIDAMLTELRGEGIDLYIATSKLRTMAMEIVDHAGWAEVFTIVGGADAHGTRYRKKDVIEWTLGQATTEVHAVAMVGDRGVDILGGRALGLAGLGVTWGYGSPQELIEAGAFSIADSTEQLIPALKGLW